VLKPTPPQQVPYTVVDTSTGVEFAVTSLSQWPQEASAAASAKGNNVSSKSRFLVKEPMVLATVLTPAEFLGSVLEELLNRRGAAGTTPPRPHD
jgi:translation elongation factor EF-4